MEIKSFYHEDTNSFSYVVFDENTKDAVLFDPVLDYELFSSQISYGFASSIVDYIKQQALTLHFIIETHIHADHLSSSQFIQKSFPLAKISISDQISLVQETVGALFNLINMAVDGSQFERLFKDNETVMAGSLQLEIIHTPGHTPTCMSVLIDGCLFCGDALFIPDFGTGRCDFPQGSAEILYDSVQNRLFTLPDETRVFVGHDYQPGGRELRYETSILESKTQNIQLTAKTTKEEFVGFRSARDKLLNTPKLFLPSLQVNIQAGQLPQQENNAVAYLKLPISVK